MSGSLFRFSLLISVPLFSFYSQGPHGVDHPKEDRDHLPFAIRWLSTGGRNHETTVAGETMRMNARNEYQNAVPGRGKSR